ncbi:hypothetical protein [Mycobacterium asiaticum]|uniref:Uncharacterized protein n=1 Tax=Mycobacterium asiaticum TaxID=1790 RepID=A0A1A3NAM6_MYCAS|nr:hypothetical protein [Mycobacterium asiaticum]OBK18104.1 hypothetical protein A5635_03175 [Mycobacterium asiaticum]
MTLPGTPTDEDADVLAAGNGNISTLFVSMAARHPHGADADYLRWHSLDHRPEQYRLPTLRASLRLVSTPECRSARVASRDPLDPVDHVMTYFFSDRDGLEAFTELGRALRDAGRMMPLLPPVQRGVYEVTRKSASPRVKVGADVLPWLPLRGVFLLVERGNAPSNELAHIDGVAGVWSAATVQEPAQWISYCFLDADPVTTAKRLRPVLEAGWRTAGTEALLAAPFHAVVPYEWDRYVP